MELFGRLLWIDNQSETEREIIEQQVEAESEYLEVLRKIGWVEP